MMMQRTDITRTIGGFAVALAIAVGAVTATAQSERTALKASAPVPDNKTVSPQARKSYADFWKELPKAKADVLERELEGIEARARRGEDVSRDVERVRREQPQIVQMSASLQSARWLVASGGGTQPATCEGIGWIGRNGRLRCIGKLTT
jgi:hypothetical protein